LSSDSILDNIRYGKPQAGIEDVMQVARTAGIHDFIMSLPEGYDTKLGAEPLPASSRSGRSNAYRLPSDCCATPRS
jgi:ABC-type multidrug transport system fused ATPase/permease subunit